LQKNKLEFVCILDWEGLNWWGFGVRRFKVLDWALNNCTTVIEGRRKLHKGALALGFWLKSAISNQVCILVRLVRGYLFDCFAFGLIFVV